MAYPTEQRVAPESPLPPPGEKRRIDLHRRRAIITADRIDVRPSREAALPPLAGFLLGVLCVALIVWGVMGGPIPYLLLAFLLLIALIAVPLAGITLVYALMGANVIFDRRKQSGTWQQGMLGMGIGTTDLVPFWKIDCIDVTEAGAPGGSLGSRTEELAQWEAVLVKQSGTRLRIAGMTVPRQFAAAGYTPVRQLADAVASLTGAAVKVEQPPPSIGPAASLPATPAQRVRGTHRVMDRPPRPRQRSRRRD
jgi:hypothetical protein